MLKWKVKLYVVVWNERLRFICLFLVRICLIILDYKVIRFLSLFIILGLFVERIIVFVKKFVLGKIVILICFLGLNDFLLIVVYSDVKWIFDIFWKIVKCVVFSYDLVVWIILVNYNIRI